MASRRVHLPPGHEPGPQSRRAARNRPIGVLFVLAFGIGLIAGGAVLFAERHGAHSNSKIVGAAVLGGFGVIVLLLGAWLLWTVMGGPRAHGVSLQVDPAEVRRGDRVRVSLTLDGAAHEVSQLQVGLVCTQYTDVKRETVNSNGTTSTSRATETSDVVTEWKEVAAGTRLQSFEFTVPAQGPFSYEGAAVSWSYRVSARTPRRLRADPHTDVPIWIRP